MVTILSKQAPLHKESALLSRFLYKFDKKFRNDIGYRKFKKVNSALRRYLTVDLLKDIKIFKTLLPVDYNIECYLPTRQMLEYVLVRIITFAKIMLRIAVCSKQSAIFYLNRIKRGESHWMSLMPYALLSRIWSMSLVLLQHSCNWYNRLYGFRKYLSHKGVAFLSEDCELPPDLGKWLNMKEMNDEGRFNWAQKSSLELDALLVENEEGDLCENILMYVDKVNSPESDDECDNKVPTLKEVKIDSESLSLNDDLGVAISRDSFKLLNNVPSTVTKQKESPHSIENVTNLSTLQDFIQQEDKYRNESHYLSLTKHLSFMQWQSLKTAMENFENKIMNKNKLQKKLVKLWKQKCLDYL
ncbi:uncharacterized protein LOC121739825 isoform X2 [Aricia agestis]|nr:uncharacterized protein LOC121739825 isoform X2 [Aricia agestis]